MWVLLKLNRFPGKANQVTLFDKVIETCIASKLVFQRKSFTASQAGRLRYFFKPHLAPL